MTIHNSNSEDDHPVEDDAVASVLARLAESSEDITSGHREDIDGRATTTTLEDSEPVTPKAKRQFHAKDQQIVERAQQATVSSSSLGKDAKAITAKGQLHEKEQLIAERALVQQQISSAHQANADASHNTSSATTQHPFVGDLLRGSSDPYQGIDADEASPTAAGEEGGNVTTTVTSETTPAAVQPEQAAQDGGFPGAFAIDGPESPSGSFQQPQGDSVDPLAETAPPPQPYTTTARLVTDEDDAERLRAELEQMRAAPTAEVVDSSGEVAKESGNTQQTLHRRIAMAMTILVLVIACIIIVVLVATRSNNDSNQDMNNVASPVENKTDSNSEEEDHLDEGQVPQLSQPILKTVKERGFIRCYVNGEERARGYGVSIELCGALSAAIFDGDFNRTEYTNATFRESWDALDYMNIDVSTSHVTFNMRRDVYETYSERPKSYTVPWYFTGAVFGGAPEMVECAEQGDTLNGVCKDLLVCVSEASTTNDVVQAHLDGSSINLIPTYESRPLAIAQGGCNVIAAESQDLYEEEMREAGYTGEWTVGSRLMSFEPLAMVTRGDDPQWTDFCNSILQAFFTAELEHITQTNISLFPQLDWFGEEYKDMYRHAIAAVGNWGDIFDRTFGLDNKIVRAGTNLPVSPEEGEKGGLLYSPPLSTLSLNPTLLKHDLPVPVPNGTLEMINQRESLQCGVFPARPGFADRDYNASDNTADAALVGLDIDLCRCLATAFFGDKELVEFVELEDPSAGYSALSNGLVDVVAGMPYSLKADIEEESTEKGYSFSSVYFYSDGREMLTLATNQIETQWTDFVRWTVYGLIYAEENGIGKEDASSMPTVDLFGPSFRNMFKWMVVEFGNYGDVYEANLGSLIPREGHNLLNDRSSPLIKPLSIEEFSS